MSKFILKLNFKGEDFGYARMYPKNSTFYGGGTESEAVEFEKVPYKDKGAAFYLKVSGTDSYLDFSFTSSVLHANKPWFSVELSTICAWELVGEELHAVLINRDITKALSRSQADPLSKALYANSPYDGNHCSVAFVQSTEKSNNRLKDELKHALV